MELIGLLGHQGVGKNYIAEVVLKEILPKKNTVILAFADHFKVDCICKHGASYKKVFEKKDFPTRRLLQLVGTEEGRNKYGSDIWIKTLETWIKLLNSRGVERFIICDVRFQNEANWIKKLNGIICPPCVCPHKIRSSSLVSSNSSMYFGWWAKSTVGAFSFSNRACLISGL